MTQTVICEKTGKTQIQAFTASPSYQGHTSKAPNVGSTEAKFCIETLEKQYRAIAKIAVLKSIESGKQVKLHLTFVGRVAFNVPEYVEHECLNAVAEIVNRYNVKVFIHDFEGKRKWNDTKWKFKTEVHKYPEKYKVQSSYNK